MPCSKCQLSVISFVGHSFLLFFFQKIVSSFIVVGSQTSFWQFRNPSAALQSLPLQTTMIGSMFNAQRFFLASLGIRQVEAEGNNSN